MIKNRIAQIIFQTVFCTLAVVGFFASLGLFDASFRGSFYVYYTNWSNYICAGLMFVCLVKTVKNKNEDNYVNIAPRFNFMCVVMILVTCLVYNFLLASQFTIVEYFTSISNLLLHVILPILFILHWVLFYEHGKTRWTYPLWATVMPLVYVVIILIRAAIINGANVEVLYPYYFLDLATLGWGNFILWIAILFVMFVALGFLFFMFDHFAKIKNKIRTTREKHKVDKTQGDK